MDVVEQECPVWFALPDSMFSLAAGYVIYSALKERTWFKEVTKKASKQAGGGPKEKTVDVSAVDRSDYLTGTPHDLLQKRKARKTK